MKVNSGKIKELLSRNVERVVVKKELDRQLRSGKKLRIKHGIDPTGDKIHIGRAVALRKLRDFQGLGHKIVLIVGDFTAQIGDPSDKLEKRPFLSETQIKKNLKNYLPQIGKIINLKRTEVHYNSAWLKKINFKEVVRLAQNFSALQMLERRNFKLRWQKQQEIGLYEFFYPLMQGYDSVAVKADVELGGSDQLFNLLAGRKIQEMYKQKPQDILTTKMLEGTDGRKMSTSWGNAINITDEPHDMFGKVMALRDELIEKYFFLTTDLSEEEIKEAKKLRPLKAKEKLAFEIVKLYHGEKSAKAAQRFFDETFREKRLPRKVSLIKFPHGDSLRKVLQKAGAVGSNSEFRRLIKGRAIEIDGEVISDLGCKLQREGIVRVGKKKFLRVRPE